MYHHCHKSRKHSQRLHPCPQLSDSIWVGSRLWVIGSKFQIFNKADLAKTSKKGKISLVNCHCQITHLNVQFLNYIHPLCVCMLVHVCHDARMGVGGGQRITCGSQCLLLHDGTQGLNSGHQAWQQVPQMPEPFFQHAFEFLAILFLDSDIPTPSFCYTPVSFCVNGRIAERG